MSTSSATTTYSYAGTNYANPHAATSIGSATQTYDNNGNLTSNGTWNYTWDYRDRMTQSAAGAVTSTYGYDHSTQRVWQRTSTSATTTYPNLYYSVTQGASSTAYIYAGNDLVAFIDTGTTTSATSYVHPDHLGSTHVVTNASGTVAQALDYYPYGNERIDSGTDVSQRQYIGQYFDEESELSYLQARYMDPAKGQFLSQDPMFLGDPRAQALRNPQTLNSYIYANGNPITLKDPTGLLGEWGGRWVWQSGIGTHEYVYFHPERTDLVNYEALGIPAGTEEFTIGFYNPGSGYLESGVYYSGQEDAPNGASDDFTGHASRRAHGRTAQIEGLSPEEEAGVINQMGEAIKSYNNRNAKYPSAAQVIAGTGVNSNSGIHTLAAISGVSSSFQSFNPPGYSSGANLLLPSQSFSSSAVQKKVQIASLKLQVAKLQLQIIQLKTAHAQSTKQVRR